LQPSHRVAFLRQIVALAFDELNVGPDDLSEGNGGVGVDAVVAK
jgi:hypothetical protein